ncbi:hypothetical protein [Microvirga calopogonii]|uniref:hypothetical protein n=1 Tax=Microvirga calopogonii TaxID=2078013 RepID=UPI000E0DB2FA|nr:hypothetical protein [Microvirga calopogonii]
MSMRPGQPSSIDGIKRLAKQIKAQKGLQHARALDEAARTAGFQNFAHANRVFTSNGPQAAGQGAPPPQSHLKEDPMSLDDFHIRARRDWAQSILSVVGAKPPSSSTWHGRDQIIAVLSAIMGSGRNHTHLPGGGGVDFVEIRISPEPGCIDLIPDGNPKQNLIYRVKPSDLILEWIEEDPGQSFFLLELNKLSPSGADPYRQTWTGDDEIFPGEEVAEVTPGGKYYPRKVYDEEITPEGESVPDAKLVVRFFQGKMMFVAKGSLWNGSRETYRGIHNSGSSKQIRQVIERWIRTTSSSNDHGES